MYRIFQCLLFCLCMLVSDVLLAKPLSNDDGTLEHDKSTSELKCQDMRCKIQYRKLKGFARKGSSIAQLLVAIAYLTGDGLPQNTDKALSNLKNASNAGSGRAAWILSHLYTENIYVKPDMLLAEKYLNIALELEFKEAYFDKAISLLDFNQPDKNEDGLIYLYKAVELESKPAQYLLAKMRRHGQLVKQDLIESAYLYKDLSQNNYRDSSTHFNEVINEVRKSSNDKNKKALTQLTFDGDIERIEVRGSKFTLMNKLAYVANRLDQSGMYGISTGTRIRGKSCANSSSSCGAISDTEDVKKCLMAFNILSSYS